MTGIALGTLALTVIGLVVALLLGHSSRRFASNDTTVVDTIMHLLPQTQCAQCGYPGCRPYAEAIAAGEAINKCPPGGASTVRELAGLLGRPVEPLAAAVPATAVALIREAECIGCALCLKACPVDAIVGAPQMMHTVIAAECTGCELCIDPCPVDCIDLIETGAAAPAVDAMHFNCIRCGNCERACPRDLLPQELLWFRDMPATLEQLDIDRCIECRLCDRVCPDGIPLTAVFQTAKRDIAAGAAEKARARHAETRFTRHTARIAAREEHIRPRPSAGAALALLDTIREHGG